MLISLFIFLAFCVRQHFWCSQSFLDFKNCASDIYKRQVTAGSSSRPNVLNRPIIEVWNASISSQNNPQSCHLYELMSPWGFTFRQNISEMEVGRHLCQNSFSSRLISNSRSNDHRHVRDKFCGQKVPRTLESFKRFSTNLETLTLFTNHIDVFRILAPQYIWLWTEKYHKEGVNVSFWQFYSGFCAPSAFIYPQG